MKIRNGFVSNSSSSSFIIRFNKDKDVKTQINDLLDEVIDVFDLEDDIQYCTTEDIDEDNYPSYDAYHKVLIKTYKEHVLTDLCNDLQFPMDRETIKEDIELANSLDKIDFSNSSQFKNQDLLHYDWYAHGYEFNYQLAQSIIDDTENDYYTLWVSDHWNEDTNYDGALEMWLQYEKGKYVVKSEDHH